MLESISGCRLTVTLEDHFLTGGLYSIVAELLLARGVTGKVLPIALRERWFTPGLLAGVLARFGMQAFSALQTALGLVLAMLVAYLLARRALPRVPDRRARDADRMGLGRA